MTKSEQIIELNDIGYKDLPIEVFNSFIALKDTRQDLIKNRDSQAAKLLFTSYEIADNVLSQKIIELKKPIFNNPIPELVSSYIYSILVK